MRVLRVLGEERQDVVAVSGRCLAVRHQSIRRRGTAAATAGTQVRQQFSGVSEAVSAEQLQRKRQTRHQHMHTSCLY